MKMQVKRFVKAPNAFHRTLHATDFIQLFGTQCARNPLIRLIKAQRKTQHTKHKVKRLLSAFQQFNSIRFQLEKHYRIFDQQTLIFGDFIPSSCSFFIWNEDKNIIFDSSF